MMNDRPFTTFNFKIKIVLPGSDRELCEAAFSECDGIEMTLQPKTIREGGNNGRQIHLAGPVSYGQLTLKRGMTSNFELWTWFDEVQQNPRLRASGEIELLPSDRGAASATGQNTGQGSADAIFSITGCLPVKLKAPALNAKEGLIAIEEMQIAYETLRLGR